MPPRSRWTPSPGNWVEKLAPHRPETLNVHRIERHAAALDEGCTAVTKFGLFAIPERPLEGSWISRPASRWKAS